MPGGLQDSSASEAWIAAVHKWWACRIKEGRDTFMAPSARAYKLLKNNTIFLGALARRLLRGYAEYQPDAEGFDVAASQHCRIAARRRELGDGLR
jgi:hypothetical protein